jgi:hypothetical protein
MLHLYVLVVRARALKPEEYHSFHSQMVNHFFLECEAVMQINHDMTSRSMRSPYIKDLFIQWRGAIAAYDEGLVRGDAALASAVWRNLFKAREDVDITKVARVVSWMRRNLCRLGAKPDSDFLGGNKLFVSLPGLSRPATTNEEIPTTTP